MKNLLIAFLFIAQTLPAQPIRSVSVTNPTPELLERVQREGEPYASQYYNGAVVWDGTTAGGGMVVGSPYTPTKGKAFVVTSISIGSSRTAILQLSRQTVNGALLSTRHIVNGSASFPENYIIRSWDSAPSLRLLGVTDPVSGTVTPANSTTLAVTCSMTGYQIADDFHFDAEKVIYAVGDSKMNGSGATLTENLLLFRLRNYFTSIGQDVRLTYRARSGYTSTDHENDRLRGYYNLEFSPKLIVLDPGTTNDAIGGVAPATSSANVLKLIAHFRAQPKTKKAIIVVLATMPLSNTTSEANAALIRAALSTAIAGLRSGGDLNTWYVASTGSMWNPVTGAGANQTDGIHPNDTGNGVWFNSVKTFISDNNIILP